MKSNMTPTGQKKNSIDSNSNAGSPPPQMRKLSRSQSITTSAIPPNIYLPPEMQIQYRRRRESLERLQLDKVAPWMHLHDFSDGDPHVDEQLRKRRASLEKLQLDKHSPWMHMHDFSEPEPPATGSTTSA